MPSGNDYIPDSDAKLAEWYNNFAAKLDGYKTPLAIIPTEMDSVRADATFVSAIIANVVSAKSEATERVKYKDDMLGKPLGTPAPAVPQPPPLITPAVVVAPGIVARTRALVARIKAHPQYSDSMGRDLRIAATTPVPPAIVKPKLTAQTVVGSSVVVLRFVKSGYAGVFLETQRGTETSWTPLATALASPFGDDRSLLIAGVPENRRYRARFRKGNAAVGEFSDTVNVVAG